MNLILYMYNETSKSDLQIKSNNMIKRDVDVVNSPTLYNLNSLIIN